MPKTSSKRRKPEGKPADLTIEYLPVAELRAYPGNAREHSPEQVEMLAKSIREFGFVVPVLIEADGTIVGGHGRLQAAQVCGLERVPCVRLAHLSRQRAAALRIADNRLAEVATWDANLLATELERLNDEGFELDAIGFDDAAFRDALAAVERETTAEIAPVEPDAPVEPSEPLPPAIAVTRPGDLWLLGDHRLLCGDSLEPENLKRLLGGKLADAVVTDPPYAIYGSSTGVSASVTDDSVVRPFFQGVLLAVHRSTRLFAHAYVCCDWRSWPSWWEAARATHLKPQNLIVWDKGGAGLGNHYANTYELVGFFAHLPKQKTMRGSGESGQRPVFGSNIVRAARVTGAERQHNAAKPVELLKVFIENSAKEGELVLDPFAGSGSTLLACEQTKRACCTCEKEPGYCDVTIDRWQRLTGKQARLFPGNGRASTFKAVAAERAKESK